MVGKKIHPYMFIILTFLLVIALGTICLAMPFASTSGKSFGFVDSLFMSTSAVCVTGLAVKSCLNDMTLFGKIIMIILMEIGGLSIITIAVFFFTIIGGKIGVSNSFLLREALNQNSVNGILGLVIRIMIISFSVQLIGTLIDWYPIYEYCEYLHPGSDYNVIRSLGISIFHSAASFNNAGFDIFSEASMEVFSSTGSVISTTSTYVLNITTMVMIILGATGFVVFIDVFKKKHWKNFKLHTKVTLITTVLLIIFGGLFIKLTSNMAWLEAFFTSVTSRTAGFATYNMANLTNYPAAYFIVVTLMIIGASPCSTGGGIKTTTFAILVLAISSFARGKRTKLFYRTVPNDSIFKAFVLTTVAVMILFVGTVVVCAIQPALGFERVFFEVSSAFSTTGLSMGITCDLNWINRLVICVLMLLGRLGPLTVIGVVNKNWMAETTDRIQFVEESVIIG